MINGVLKLGWCNRKVMSLLQSMPHFSAAPLFCLLLYSSVLNSWFVPHAWFQVQEAFRLPFICPCVCDDCMLKISGSSFTLLAHSFLQPSSATIKTLCQILPVVKLVLCLWGNYSSYCFIPQAVHGLTGDSNAPDLLSCLFIVWDHYYYVCTLWRRPLSTLIYKLLSLNVNKWLCFFQFLRAESEPSFL